MPYLVKSFLSRCTDITAAGGGAASVCFLVHCRGAVVRHGGVVGEGFALVTKEMPG